MNAEKLFRDFLKIRDEKELKIEALAIADRERILCEKHYVYDYPRNIYSHTKSYMVTAAAMAIGDGLLSLDTRLTDLFPEDVPEDADPRLFTITLRNLLTMASGFGKPYLMGEGRRKGEGFPDYMKYMLSRPILKDPGSFFDYSTADSILAGRMIEKVTGKQLESYLYERLFTKLGQGFPQWECDPEGHPIGGGGMFMKLSDMLKIGQLYLNDGVWQGERLLSSDWVKEATREQISTDPNPDNYVWRCGYGYQFWMCPYEGSYRADGAYGQITLVLPKQELIVSCQCPEDGAFGEVANAMHEYLLLPLTEN